MGHNTISCNTLQLLLYTFFSYLNVFIYFSVLGSFANLGVKFLGVRVYLFWIKTDRKKIRNFVLKHYFSKKYF